MIDPDKWSIWLKLLFFPPLIAGALCMWVYPSLAKSPKVRRVQIALMAYAGVFGAFAWNVIAGTLAALLAVLAVLIFLTIRWRHSKTTDLSLGRKS